MTPTTKRPTRKRSSAKRSGSRSTTRSSGSRASSQTRSSSSSSKSRSSNTTAKRSTRKSSSQRSSAWPASSPKRPRSSTAAARPDSALSSSDSQWGALWSRVSPEDGSPNPILQQASRILPKDSHPTFWVVFALLCLVGVPYFPITESGGYFVGILAAALGTLVATWIIHAFRVGGGQ